MHLVEVIAYVVEDVRVVVGLEHFAEDGGYGTIFGCTLERAGVGKESQERSGSCTRVDVFKVFPLGIEANDGFVDRIVTAAVDLSLRPMVLREEIEETVSFLFGTSEILIAIGIEKEFLGAGVILLSDARST